MLTLCSASETRLIETLENVCDRFLRYSVHAERPGSLRYSRGRSQTMETLWGLRYVLPRNVCHLLFEYVQKQRCESRPRRSRHHVGCTVG